ncbi:MAG: sulfite exporter TauE/SafE family protein [Candidatus Binatia bacterium]|nr:sulfite exporter TauE/SafE family protein [Candidatus Binatia bacterium]
MTLTELGLIIASGLAAGFINAVSGGGGMLTVPALIFIGFPPGVANGTNRVAVVIQNLAAMAAYHRLRITDHRLAFSLSLPAILGALCGALVSVRLDDAQFRTLLGIVMLGLLGPILAEPKLHTHPAIFCRRGRRGWILRTVFFALGLYGGLLQIGVGVFILVALSTIGGMDLVPANGVKVVIVFCLTAVALLVFVANGKVAWGAAFLMATANAVGAWLGAHWGVRKGAFWIRGVLVATVFVMALYLLGALSWIAPLLDSLRLSGISRMRGIG